MSDRTDRSDGFVQSLARGLSVIRALGAECHERTLSDIACTTGLTRATARRFLVTLANLGYVRTDGRLFELTPRVLELGFAYLSGLSLREVADRHLEALVTQVRESASVSVLDEDDIVCVARVVAPRFVTASVSVGTRLPAHATASGRVLLANLPPEKLDAHLARAELCRLTPRTITCAKRLRAELELVRSQGWALVSGELDEGLRSISCPIRDQTDRVVASISLSGHLGRLTADSARRELLPSLRTTATCIEAELRASTPYYAARRS